MPDLIRVITLLIPARGGMFRWFGPNLEITNIYSTHQQSTEFYLQELYRQPRETAVCRPLEELIALPEPSPVLQVSRHTIIVDRPAFLRSEYYNLLHKPTECDECLMLRVRQGGRNLGALYIWRGPGDIPFNAAELGMLERIAGFVAHSIVRPTLEDDAFADSDDRALFVAEPDGTLRHIGAQARRLLTMALIPRWSPTARWLNQQGPAPEIASLCLALAATAKGQIGQPPPVLRLQNPWGAFTLRAYWLGPTDGTEPPCEIGITIERLVPRILALHRRVESLPLTAREKQLCLLLARDLSCQDLANMMGLAASTVVTHQRSVYAKLGVHSRTGLLAALQPPD